MTTPKILHQLDLITCFRERRSWVTSHAFAYEVNLGGDLEPWIRCLKHGHYTVSSTDPYVTKFYPLGRSLAKGKYPILAAVHRRARYFDAYIALWMDRFESSFLLDLLRLILEPYRA